MTGPRQRTTRQRAPRKRAAPFRCRLVVMAKVPVAGGAKTRLAREIGVAAATRFARQATAALLQRVAHDRRWQTILAVSPDAGVGEPLLAARHCPHGAGSRRPRPPHAAHHGAHAAGSGGDRRHRRSGHQPAHIAEAFRRLGRHDAVFGPAADGGYWLVGLRRRPRLLHPFADVRWSSEHALADTLANLEGRSVAFVATLERCRRCARLRAELAARFGRRIPSPRSSRGRGLG